MAIINTENSNELNFVALYYENGVKGISMHSDKDDAVRFLKGGNDYGNLLGIAVIDKTTKEIVYFNDFIGEEFVKDEVVEFIDEIIK